MMTEIIEQKTVSCCKNLFQKPSVAQSIAKVLGANKREAAIAAFKPEPFYTFQIDLGGFTAASERFKNKSEAEAVS